MASGSVRPATAPPESKVSADKLIDSQLGRVRRHIRITDLIAGIMVLFAGLFGCLILVAVVDHWIVGLGVAGRLLVLLALIGGAGWHLAVNVVPLLLRRINPAYAAQTIERGEPSLKNSLLNYLLLRRESEGMQALVYQAVQQRAAADVARVEVDQTVDRTALIRAGYVLAAIMAVAAAYKILSRKTRSRQFAASCLRGRILLGQRGSRSRGSNPATRRSFRDRPSKSRRSSGASEPERT